MGRIVLPCPVVVRGRVFWICVRCEAMLAVFTFFVKLLYWFTLMFTSPRPQLQFPQSAAPTATPAAKVNAAVAAVAIAYPGG